MKFKTEVEKFNNFKSKINNQLLLLAVAGGEK